MIEYDLQKECQDYLNAMPDCEWIHLGYRVQQKYGTNKKHKDWPDLIIFLKTKTLFVELKRPGQKPRQGQIEKIIKLRSLGFETFVIDTFRDFTKIFTINIKINVDK